MRNQWDQTFRIALDACRSSPLRSALTALTIALGAAAISSVLSIANSTFSTIMSGVDSAGGRQLIFVESREPTLSSRPTDRRLTVQDARELAIRVPEVQSVDWLAAQRQAVVQRGKQQATVDVAIGLGLFKLTGCALTAGRELLPDDAGFHEPEVVIAEPVATELFGASAAAIDQDVLLVGKRFRVAGVCKDRGLPGFNVGAVDKHRSLFVSEATYERHLGGVVTGFIILRSKPGADHDLQIRVANSILLARHQNVDDFEFFDLELFVARFEVVFTLLRVVLVFVAGIGLLVAGAGIVHVMLASIRQRLVEFGIRRALGATQTDLLRQVLVEATTLALAGGVLGGVAGSLGVVLVGQVVVRVVPAWVVDSSWVPVAVSIGASWCVGGLFGLIPARRASRLSVVESLRGVSL